MAWAVVVREVTTPFLFFSFQHQTLGRLSGASAQTDRQTGTVVMSEEGLLLI
jgi:hypothetical protein